MKIFLATAFLFCAMALMTMGVLMLPDKPVSGLFGIAHSFTLTLLAVLILMEDAKK
jgi:hypothetical protein